VLFRNAIAKCKVLSFGGPFWTPVFRPLVLFGNISLIFKVSSFGGGC
jgi:hypothetical protein